MEDRRKFPNKVIQSVEKRVWRMHVSRAQTYLLICGATVAAAPAAEIDDTLKVHVTQTRNKFSI